MAANTKIWRLKRGSDRRVRGGHPWVYSNELQGSPKGIEPGEKVLLLDAAGKFLAHGYGNPSSLISFRAVSRVEDDPQWDSVDALTKRLANAWQFRKGLGVTDFSFRWIFGEGDDFPGLILDAFRTEDSRLIVVVQAHTAGVDRLLPNLLQAIERVTESEGHAADAIVLRNDVSHRKLEGIPVEEPKVLGKVSADGERIRIRSALAGGEPLLFKVDLVKGQKTGFFLDQAENIGQLLDLALRSNLRAKKTVRVLDLCSYVGQWSAQIAAAFKKRGVDVEVLLVDASARALAFAKENAEKAGAKAEIFEADVLEDLPKLANMEFDIVICDPPALIPSRKDIPIGTHAYLKLNTEAFRLLAAGGSIVTCSCSQLLDEESFAKQISKAASRHQKRIGWLARGTQALDHPLKLEFAEGRYLKMWIGREYAMEN